MPTPTPPANETALVTGASSGIGRELARLLARHGTNLVLVARREERLSALARELERDWGAQSVVHAVDLSEPTDRLRLFRELTDRGPLPDVLVNNAGFGLHGSVAELDRDRQLEMIELNVTALTDLTRLFLPGMMERGKGGILNVASTAAFQPGPNLSVYYATKAYVLSFSEGLAEELRGTGVGVTCLAPGPTVTEFAEEAGMRRSLLFRMGTMKASQVAAVGYRGFRKGRTVVIPGLLNALLASTVRFVPRSLVRKAVNTLHREG